MPSKTANANSPSPRRVVIVAYDGAKLMDICGPLQAFSDARNDQGHAAYQVILASEEGGAVTTDTGIKLETIRLAETPPDAIDTLLVAGVDSASPLEAPPGLAKRLGGYISGPRRLGSICTGAFVLAGLGVLDGQPATTHWAVCDRLARDYPAIEVKPDAIFTVSGNIWTSAGVSAGIDMALAMIEDDIGHLAALSVARGLVLFLKRPGGQSQFSIELRRQVRDARGRFDDLHDWIRANLEKDLSVPLLADAAAMSPRNFARVYQRETGESPARAVEKLRVEAARRLLEMATDPIQTIARRTGFVDDERMRRAFIKALGIPPQDYRSRFTRLLA